MISVYIILCMLFLHLAEEERVAFVQALSLKGGMTHMVNREIIFESVTALYRNESRYG